MQYHKVMTTGEQSTMQCEFCNTIFRLAENEAMQDFDCFLCGMSTNPKKTCVSLEQGKETVVIRSLGDKVRISSKYGQLFWEIANTANSAVLDSVSAKMADFAIGRHDAPSKAYRRELVKVCRASRKA
jgi:hypothetical protein